MILKFLQRLLEHISLDEVFEILNKDSSMDFSERILRAKAMSRIKSYKIGGLIVSFTRVGSSESHIANFLIKSFADIAIVEDVRSDEVRISGRARKYLEGKINLAKLFKTIEKDIKGNGGGHDLAAGANGTDSSNLDKVRKKLISAIEQTFSTKAKAL